MQTITLPFTITITVTGTATDASTTAGLITIRIPTSTLITNKKHTNCYFCQYHEIQVTKYCLHLPEALNPKPLPTLTIRPPNLTPSGNPA